MFIGELIIFLPNGHIHPWSFSTLIEINIVKSSFVLTINIFHFPLLCFHHASVFM